MDNLKITAYSLQTKSFFQTYMHVCMYVCISERGNYCQKQFRLFSGQRFAVDKEH